MWNLKSNLCNSIAVAPTAAAAYNADNIYTTYIPAAFDQLSRYYMVPIIIAHAEEKWFRYEPPHPHSMQLTLHRISNITATNQRHVNIQLHTSIAATLSICNATLKNRQ